MDDSKIVCCFFSLFGFEGGDFLAVCFYGEYESN